MSLVDFVILLGQIIRVKIGFITSQNKCVRSSWNKSQGSLLFSFLLVLIDLLKQLNQLFISTIFSFLPLYVILSMTITIFILTIPNRLLILLQLSNLVLERAVRGGMRFGVAKVALDCGRISQQLLGTLIKFVPLLPTTFTPDSFESLGVINHNFHLLDLIGLVNDRLNHPTALVKILFAFCGQKHMQRFFFLTVFAKHSGFVCLTARTSNLYPTPTFLFQFLLSDTFWANYLTDVGHRGIFWWGHKNLALSLGRLIIWRRHISWIHLQYFVNQPLAFLVVLVFEALLSRVCSQARLPIVDRFGRGRSQIVIIHFREILSRNPILQIVNAMSPYGNLDLFKGPILGQKGETLRSEYFGILVWNGLPSFSFLTCFRIFPPWNALSRCFIIQFLCLRVCVVNGVCLG